MVFPPKPTVAVKKIELFAHFELSQNVSKLVSTQFPFARIKKCLWMHKRYSVHSHFWHETEQNSQQNIASDTRRTSEVLVTCAIFSSDGFLFCVDGTFFVVIIVCIQIKSHLFTTWTVNVIWLSINSCFSRTFLLSPKQEDSVDRERLSGEVDGLLGHKEE